MIVSRNRLSTSNNGNLEDRVMLASESADFNDGTTGPFESKGAGEAAYGRYWANFNNEYDGSRWTLGSELRSDVEITSEGSAEWTMYVPTDNDGHTSYPDDKEAVVHQWFNYPDGSDSFWGAVLSIEDNDLYLTHRHYKYEGIKTKVVDDLDRNTALNFTSEIEPGNGTGSLKYTLNGETIFDESGLILGSGSFNSNGDLSGGHVEQQVGLYAADVENHEPGEKWTLYFDNISVSN